MHILNTATYQHPLHSILIGPTGSLGFCLWAKPEPGKPRIDGTSHSITPLTIFQILQVPSLAAVQIYKSNLRNFEISVSPKVIHKR